MKKEKKTILYLEDDVSVRSPIAAFLRLRDFEVIEASNGKEGLKIFEEMHIDLLITDIDMPYMDGLSLAQKIRQNSSNVPIIIISGHSDKEKLLRGIRVGLIDYIYKPVSRSALKDAINRAFSATQTKSIIAIDSEYSFNIQTKILFRNDELVVTTYQQTRALEYLLRFPNQIVSSKELFAFIREDHMLEYNGANLRNTIKRLRELLPPNAIETIHKQGYILHVLS